MTSLIAIICLYQNCGKVSITQGTPTVSSSSLPSLCNDSSGISVSCADLNTYSWTTSPWGPCNTTCGTGSESRNLGCVRGDGSPVDVSLCSQSTKPLTADTCSDISSCTYKWTSSPWSPCSNMCGSGTQTDTNSCYRSDGTTVDNTFCAALTPPVTSQTCSDYANCAALTCTAQFAPTSLSLTDDTSKGASQLTVSSNAVSGSYSCSNSGPSGTFSTANQNIPLNFGFPSTCNVTVNRPDGTSATCNAAIGVTCDPTTVQSLYDSSVAQITATQGDIATQCADSGRDYNTNLGFKPTDYYSYNYWQITCATRYCIGETDDPNALGFAPNEVFTSDHSALDPAASVAVSCTSSTVKKPSGTTNVCYQNVTNSPVLQTNKFTFGTANSSTACGNDLTSISANFAIAPGGSTGPVACGTQYCKGLNQGFISGVLADYFGSGFTIQCSRANGSVH